MTQRPLSPHLQIYKWQWSAVSSVMNRLSGILFFIGLVVFSLHIFALYTGGEPFFLMSWILSSLLGLFAQFIFLWVISYHVLQGIQHLLWDAGRLFNLSLKQHALRSYLIGIASLILAILAFCLTWSPS